MGTFSAPSRRSISRLLSSEAGWSSRACTRSIVSSSRSSSPAFSGLRRISIRTSPCRSTESRLRRMSRRNCTSARSTGMFGMA